MADSFQAGFLRDDDGALVCVFEGTAAEPVSMVGGLLRDADGAVVLV